MLFSRLLPGVRGAQRVLLTVVAITLLLPCPGLAQTNASSSPKSSDALDPATTCREHVEKRTYHVALYHCDRAIEADSTRAALHVLRGRAYLETDRPRRALDNFDTALALDAESHAAHYHRGMALHDLGRVQESIESLERAIDYSADRHEYYSLLGWYYESQSRYEKAMEAYNTALDLDPTSTRALNNRGVLLRDWQGDVGGAIRDFDRLDELLEKPSRRARNYVNRGNARMQLIRDDDAARNRMLAVQAERDFSAALDLVLEYAHARFNRGMAREAQVVNGDTTRIRDAIRDYTDVTKMIGRAPRSLVARAYFRRGLLYAMTGDQQTATESIIRAARLGMTAAQNLLKDRGIEW